MNNMQDKLPHRTENMTVKEYYDNGIIGDDDTADIEHARHAASVLCMPNFGGTVVDVGCGAGGMFNELLSAGAYEVLGVDLSKKMLAEAEHCCTDARVILKNCDFLELKEQGFDAVVAFDSYNHFSDPTAFVKKAHSILSRGGRLTVAFGCGRERLNAITRVLPEGISREISPPWGELKYWSDYFLVDCMCDTDRLYLLSGTAK